MSLPRKEKQFSRTGRHRGQGLGAPNASTIRRALSALTGDGFDTAIGTCLPRRVDAAWVGTPGRRRRRAIAVDGKALRGSRDGGQHARVVMACLDHDSGITVGQVEIAEKSNEIPMFPALLDTIVDVTGLVVTVDALHAQREHAEYPHVRGAHYVITVKGNQVARVGPEDARDHRMIVVLPAPFGPSRP
jgi:DDE family transposase